MVDVVGAQLARVIARLEDYEKNWTPTIGRQVEQARLLYNELIVNADPDSELSVTGQVVLEQCISKLNAVLTEMALQHRTIHTLISKTGKEIERHFVSDLNCLTKVDKNFDTDPKLHNRVNALIVDHLISTGKFDVAETLLKEAQLPPSSYPTTDVSGARHLVDALARKEVEPALEWLQKNAPEEEALIFDLQKQQFIKLLQEGNKMKALEYGRQLSKRTKEVTSLMWSVVVKDREKRYPDFFNPAVWKQLELRLARVLSRSENYLSQILETGIKAVPSLITVRNMMASRPPESLFQGDELPIEVDVPNHVHSVFACPILKAQCTEMNPPMRLSCGHVISREALHKLAQTGRFVHPAHLSPSASFNHIRLKCPYCPIESSMADAKRVYF
uniref:Protein RMD5 A n=1 Tax=Ascaris suum TaxID=6253 RepID=F1KT65_ASCSU